MADTVLQVFDTATTGTTWTVRDRELHVEGMDFDAEVAMVGFGGGSQLLVNLHRDVAAAVTALEIPDGTVLLPAMREAARILAGATPQVPDRTEPLTLWLLSTTGHPQLAEQIAEHPATPGPVLSRIAQRWVAGSGDRHVRLTERAWQGGAVTVAVASNRNSPGRLLAALATSADEQVRVAAAGNPSTPFQDLRRLMVGPPGRARDVATRTINTLAQQHHESPEPLPDGLNELD